MSSFAVGAPVDEQPDEALPPPPPATGLAALFDDPPLDPGEATQPVAPDSDSDDGGGLFGDDDDEPDAPQPMEQDDGLTEEERARRQHLEYDEENDEMEVIKKHEAIAQVELANFGMPATAKVWHARLPNFLSLQPQAFDDVMWEPEDADEPAPSQEGVEASPGAPKGSIPDENVIRWRWAKDAEGKPFKESNARTIRWSDGSLSLQVGAELFDISATVDHSAVLKNPSAAPAPVVKTGAPVSLSVVDENRGHGLTYLTAEHGYQGLIEAQASVYGTLTFRPTTLQSNTHRRLAGSIAGRYVKGRGIKLAELPDEDPEKKKMEREKEELARAKKLKKAQQGSSGRAGGKKVRKATRFEAGSDGEDDGEPSSSRGAKRGTGYDDEEGSEGSFIEHDTDSDGDEPSAKRSKRRPSPEYSDDEPDEMDEAEARIEREERKRKERKQGKAPAVEEPAPAPRRRMVIDESDEE